MVKQAAAAHRKLEQLGDPEQLADLALAQRAALRQELQRINAAAELWLGRLGQARPLGTPRPGGRLPAGLPPSGSKTGF